ncbi:MAG TPA: hypothetical protein VNU71_17290 [Burkholderiaceae bacterium]|nr:hypothetical protein [Burkholderiaceae bacterium]
MKTINVRELRATIPRLKEALARDRELVLVSNGEPIARITAMPADASTRPRLPSLKAFRATLPATPPLETLIREERDRR